MITYIPPGETTTTMSIYWPLFQGNLRKPISER